MLLLLLFQVGKILMCSFNRRFDPAIRRLFDAVRAGQVGPVHVIKTCARDSPFPPLEYLKISGGIFHDCLVHDIDLICWILGCYPTRYNYNEGRRATIVRVWGAQI